MAFYIKANSKVVKFLGLEGIRNRLSDGNYLLWQADMLHFGPLYQIRESVAKIGGVLLQPAEARQEQDGVVVRPLPEATDDRFKTDVEVVNDENTIIEESVSDNTTVEAETGETASDESVFYDNVNEEE